MNFIENALAFNNYSDFCKRHNISPSNSLSLKLYFDR